MGRVFGVVSRLGGTRARGVVLLLCAALLAVGCKKEAAQPGAVVPAGPGSVPPPPGGNLLKVATFDDGKSLPWMTVFSRPADGGWEIKDGAYCVNIDNVGVNRWDAQLRHREMIIQSGHSYTLQFRAWASKPTKAYPKVGMSGPPYDEYFGKLIRIAEVPQFYQAQFRVDRPDDPTAEFAMHLGGGLATPGAPVTVCIDDVYLSDEQFTPPPPEEAAPVPDVRVNQVGYLPSFGKVATVVDAAEQPVHWQLFDAQGNVVKEGETSVFGDDVSSGDHVHLVDFSDVTHEGAGYVLQVGQSKSDPFDIKKDLYSKLKYDALAYFYHTRSGIDIEMPFAGEEKWTRPAGHKPDKAECTPQAVLKKTGWDVPACDYTLDVTGGWYDAGDQGKYVVNGGISVWTLLNQYERFKLLGTSVGDFGDGKLNIPEQGNKVPDILDEARWELDFMLKMMVPDGQPLAGMVHHKMHDSEWTALGLPPHKDPKSRYLRPPSTAATLNLAATAAQASRLFKPLDGAYAQQLLAAAEKAYAAAKQNPKLFAPDDGQDGGGPYNDDQVEDEFYWAAAELFITTGKPAYKQDMLANGRHKVLHGAAGTESIMSWRETDGLGAISLAIANSKLAKPEKEAQRARLIAVADKYLEAADSSGYRPPFKVGGTGYPWGSNSFVVNNMLVMALAYDFTKDKKYRDGVGTGMDYLFGRNAMAKSYVTGYGERPLQNPHHRFWAHQASHEFPEPPPGIVSGGPNSGLEDPYVQAAGLTGCKPQKCFADNIEAWSTNEITINWNAPFAWVAAWLDEQGKR